MGRPAAGNGAMTHLLPEEMVSAFEVGVSRQVDVAMGFAQFTQHQMIFCFQSLTNGSWQADLNQHRPSEQSLYPLLKQSEYPALR